MIEKHWEIGSSELVAIRLEDFPIACFYLIYVLYDDFNKKMFSGKRDKLFIIHMDLPWGTVDLVAGGEA